MMQARLSTAAVRIPNQPHVAPDLLFQDEHMASSHRDRVVAGRRAGKPKPVTGQIQLAHRLAEQMDGCTTPAEGDARAPTRMRLDLRPRRRDKAGAQKRRR